MNITEADAAAIRAKIEQQLDAFRRDDGATAFACASFSIQQLFKTPAEFMTMVRSSYQPVYRPRSVVFDDLVLVNGDLAQKVLFFSQDAEVYTAFYLMERPASGQWKINGCLLHAGTNL
ncbi:MAG: DUF4864 domain-containing protein [Oscillatoriales cyanobacterium SM2_2_1]|nr:DUF4864 domain-containing protein [Oscillatoriales cyanobacterium SM2_2_1]